MDTHLDAKIKEKFDSIMLYLPSCVVAIGDKLMWASFLGIETLLLGVEPCSPNMAKSPQYFVKLNTKVDLSKKRKKKLRLYLNNRLCGKTKWHISDLVPSQTI